MDQIRKINITRNVAYISGVFSALVAFLMLLNYWQIKSNEPLESKSMELLIERMRDEPDNEELKKEIRDLDLLARKAFFTSQWQINTGRYLMLFGAIVCIASVRYYYSLTFKKQKPKKQISDEEKIKIRSLKWISATGGFMFLVAFLSSFLVVNHLEIYKAEDMNAGQEVKSPAGETIEMIDITESSDEQQPDETPLVLNKQSADSLIKSETESRQEARAISEQSEKVTVAEYPSLADIRANHNSFRGPLGQGVSYSRNIPADWDGATGRNIRWKIQLAKPGNNSPVIWGDKIYIAGADNQGGMIYCIDLLTGKILWQQEVKDIPGSPENPPRVTEDAGLSAPTVTTDGNRVYAIYANGDIVACSNDGTFVWKRNLGLPDNHYGHSSSLIVWKNQVFIQFDTNRGGRILSLNSQSGKTIWDTRRNVRISWASPILAEINGKYQLIVSADPIVSGFDIETGNELWSVECMMGEVGPSPAFSDGLVYAANEYARLVAIKPGPSATVVWENNEYLPEVASPVVSEGLLFISTTYGVLVCYDAKTGEKYWEREFNQGFYSSPVIADGKLFAADLDGITHIFRVSKTPELIGEPQLGEKMFATPAFSDGRIFLRGEKSLYCIGQK